MHRCLDSILHWNPRSRRGYLSGHCFDHLFYLFIEIFISSLCVELGAYAWMIMQYLGLEVMWIEISGEVEDCYTSLWRRNSILCIKIFSTQPRFVVFVRKCLFKSSQPYLCQSHPYRLNSRVSSRTLPNWLSIIYYTFQLVSFWKIFSFIGVSSALRFWWGRPSCKRWAMMQDPIRGSPQCGTWCICIYDVRLWNSNPSSISFLFSCLDHTLSVIEAIFYFAWLWLLSWSQQSWPEGL